MSEYTAEQVRACQGVFAVGRSEGLDDAQCTIAAREFFRERGWPDPAPLIFDWLPRAHILAWNLKRPIAHF
jgi:hypothetical protein